MCQVTASGDVITICIKIIEGLFVLVLLLSILQPAILNCIIINLRLICHMYDDIKINACTIHKHMIIIINQEQE